MEVLPWDARSFSRGEGYVAARLRSGISYHPVSIGRHFLKISLRETGIKCRFLDCGIFDSKTAEGGPDMDTNGLSPAHIKALDLLREGNMTYKNIAKAVGIAESTLKHWIAGDPKAGTTAMIFSEEAKKLRRKKKEETVEKLEEIQYLIAQKLNIWIKQVRDPLSIENAKIVTRAFSVVSEATKLGSAIEPAYKKMTPEEALAEFKRFKALARGL